MGTALVKIKIMPESPSSNLKEIKDKAEKLVKIENGKGIKLSEEPIAFGLKAIFVSFEWPEEKDLDELEGKMRKITDVRSAEVSDIRRAIG
jgi:translation elongation factor aEF-1 beta